MNHLWLAVVLVFNTLSAWQPFEASYHHAELGRVVTVCLDGRTVERTFAGKLAFEDQKGVWYSVCADVRSPITEGDRYFVRPLRTSKLGGNLARAGNIVARYFDEARTPDECAGLQLAVWKALEDGGPRANFDSGHFQARATPAIIADAQKYYQASDLDGDALFLQSNPGGGATGGGGQSQLSTVPTDL